MDCQRCRGNPEGTAFCLPCGHMFCGLCVNWLQPRVARVPSIECNVCRQVTPSRIGPYSVRKVFLNQRSPSPDIRFLRNSLQKIEAERDAALRELKFMKAELAQAQATIATALPAKDREICEVKEKLLALATEYHEEVAEHRQARRELQKRDAEIKNLRELQAVALPSTSATVGDPSIGQVANRIRDSPLSPQAAADLEEARRSCGRDSVNTTPLTNVKPEQPAGTMKSGDAILSRGYGPPKHTPVPECTAYDGYHVFSGKGTNQYARKFRCGICGFSCSESW